MIMIDLWTKLSLGGSNRAFGELTNELFFQCIRQSPRYLSYEPFIKKILQWQETLYDKYEVNGKFKTKENLKKIGIELSFGGSGRRPLNNNPSTSTN